METKKQQDNMQSKPGFHKIEYTQLEDPNLGLRRSMEDFIIIYPDILGKDTYSFFCILDGHGGADVAKFVKASYPKVLKQILEKCGKQPNMDKVINESIKKIESQLKMQGFREQGSTFCGVIVDFYQKQAYHINIGDSQCVQILNDKGYKFLRISELHKTTNQKEVERVKKMGGMIFQNRLAGNLLVTRALGDFGMQEYGLISVPYICRLKLLENSILVLASDGIWDVVTNDVLKQLFDKQKSFNLKQFAEDIVHFAQKDSQDNISLIVIRII